MWEVVDENVNIQIIWYQVTLACHYSNIISDTIYVRISNSFMYIQVLNYLGIAVNSEYVNYYKISTKKKNLKNIAYNFNVTYTHIILVSPLTPTLILGLE